MMRLVYWLAAIAALLAVLAFAAMRLPGAFSDRAIPPLPTVPVLRGDLEQTVLANGALEAVRSVQVGARVGGQLQAVHVALGDLVKEGDLVAELDSAEQQAQLRQARAAHAEAEVTLKNRLLQIEKAETALNRQLALRKGQAGSDAELQDAEFALRAARLEADVAQTLVGKARWEVEKAETQLTYTRILSPLTGRVVALAVRPGQMLNAAQTTPVIAVIADISHMTARLKVSEADIGKVQVGQALTFTTYSRPGETRQSRLAAIDPAPEGLLPGAGAGAGALTAEAGAKAVYFNALFDADNPDGSLMPMMSVEARIVVKSVRNALLVPWPAVKGPMPDGSHIVKIKGPSGLPETRSVRIGLTDQVMAEVLEGLSEGDAVLLYDGTMPLPMTLPPMAPL